MKVELGQHIKTRDGKDMGAVKYLIFAPEQERVRAVVVERGMLLKEDVEIALEELRPATDGSLWLERDEADIEALPHFNIGAYTPAPPDFTTARGYATTGVFWPMGYPIGAYSSGYPARGMPAVLVADETAASGEASDRQITEAEEIQRQMDAANAVISAGADVITSDGQKVGEVASVALDLETGRPLSFVVRKGVLFHKDVEISGERIAGMDDGVIYLNVDREHFDAQSEPSAPKAA